MDLATLLIWSQRIKIRDILITEYLIETRIWSTQPCSGQTISNGMNSNILFACCSFFLPQNEPSFILDTEIYYRVIFCYNNAFCWTFVVFQGRVIYIFWTANKLDTRIL